MNHADALIRPKMYFTYKVAKTYKTACTNHILDHRAPAKAINLDIYKVQERRRADRLRIKLDTEEELLTWTENRPLYVSSVDRTVDSPVCANNFVRWTRPTMPSTQQMINEQIGQALGTTRQKLDT